MAENAGAALVHSVALAAGLEPLEHVFHALNPGYLRIKFGLLSLGDCSPPRGERSRLPESRKKLPDFLESKSHFLRPPQDGKLVHSTHVIPSWTAYASRRG